MVLLTVIAFVAGVLTILSPCILPILPIVLSAGATGKRGRPLGIAVGFIVSFTVSVVALGSLIALTGIPASALRGAAIGLLFILGVVLLVPALRDRTELWLDGIRRFVPAPSASASTGGFGGGVVVGICTGVLCTPCAGPILTAVVTLAAASKVTSSVVLIAVAYAVGIAVPLAAVSRGARALTQRLRGAARWSSPAAGGLLLLTSLAMVFGVDQRAQVWAAQATTWTSRLQAVENAPAVVQRLGALRGQDLGRSTNLPGLTKDGPAPPFVDLTNWMNSPPLTTADLRGKVTLIDFWTYSCVNCVRDIPHLEAWYRQYQSDGFQVIGVHSPEFAFEHDPSNVAAAVAAQHITYPVALDNQLGTWNAFQNLYWPALYLVDATGTIEYIHDGESDYPTTEAAIRTLLTESGHPPTQPTTTVADRTPQDQGITAETYLGSDKLQTFDSPQKEQAETAATYSLPNGALPLGDVAFVGRWTLQPEYAQGDTAGTIALAFYADRVYVVLAPASPGQQVTVLLDGRPVPAADAGADVQHGVVTLDQSRLYALVDFHSPVGSQHELRLQFAAPGVKAYSFTFG